MESKRHPVEVVLVEAATILAKEGDADEVEYVKDMVKVKVQEALLWVTQMYAPAEEEAEEPAEEPTESPQEDVPQASE